MGWFDGSDDDEDEQEKAKMKRSRLPPSSITSEGWFDEDEDEKKNDDDVQSSGDQGDRRKKQEEEEDSLDAYLSTLQRESASTHQGRRAARLDVDNEDEGTNYWEKEEVKAKTIEKSASVLNQKQNSETNADDTDNQDSSSFGFAPKLGAVQHQLIQYQPFRCNFLPLNQTDMGRKWRLDNDVACSPIACDPVLAFDGISTDVFPSPLRQVIEAKGYHSPTPVQAQTLPFALHGKDCLVTAATGGGKTFAYVWPMVIHVCDQPHFAADETGPIGLVLVPTRELASQVQKHVSIMLESLKGKSMCVAGGMGSYQLIQEMKRKGGVEVVVGTPGRLLDAIQTASGAGTKKQKYGISLRRVTMVVLDEADKMLDMGFESQVGDILNNIRPDRQSLLFSATMSRKMERVAAKWLTNDYVRIAIGMTGRASEFVQQVVLVLPSLETKKTWLVEMLPTLISGDGQTLIFVASRADCEAIADDMRSKRTDFTIETLHGDKHQDDRRAALKAFAKGRLSALVATDVASRGLDVSNVSTVINFDPAKNLDTHTHRIGRAGRLKKDGSQERQKGTAFTLLTPRNVAFARVLMGALEREGRHEEVSPELRALANSANHYNTGRSHRWKRGGSDFEPSSGHARGHVREGEGSTLSPLDRKRSRFV